MTLNLLDLPQDILDEFLQNLMPPLSTQPGHVPLRDLKCTPDPIDLGRVALTCKMLYNIAQPWIWQRAHFDGSLGRSLYLCDHPETAAHVRLLIFDWIPGTSRPFLALTARPAMRLMNNLRVLVIRAWGFYPDLLSEFFKELTSKPRLHTLFTLGLSELSDADAPPSLQHFGYSAVFMTPKLTLDMLPRLKSLAISVKRVFQHDLYVPWETLCDIEIAGMDSWLPVLQSLSAWKQAFPEKRSPLTAVTIRAEFKLSDMWNIVETLKGQNLRSLLLSGVPSDLDQPCVQQLVQDFPDLQSLGLYMGMRCRPWPIDLRQIAQTLGRLPNLTSLRWNYGREPHLFEGTWIYDQDMLSAVAKHCPTVQSLQIRNWTLDHFFCRRDGHFVEDARIRYVLFLQNSSWASSAYDQV